ncbi:hypothetical protein X801_00769, partial [Opisthorchis viverrini]
FAPWCPACRQFSAVWKQLSDEPGLGVHIAAVDVTESPVLSFVFFRKGWCIQAIQWITKLHRPAPVSDRETVYSHGAYPMVLLTINISVSDCFYFSPRSQYAIILPNVHQYLLDSGYPTWLSFIIIGSGTIIFGLVLGTILVILFDCIVPPRPQICRFFTRREDPRKSTISPSTSTTKKIEEREVITHGTHKLSVDASGEHQDESEELEVRKRSGDSKD